MHVNQSCQMPSELQDSHEDISYYGQNSSIKAINRYQLEQYLSEDQESKHKGLEIQQQLDQSSIENDDFLQMVKRQQKMLQNSTFDTKQLQKNATDLLVVDKTNIELCLLQSQTAKQTISFNNPTANPIKISFSNCPFRIQSDNMLDFVLAGQLQVIIQPWQRIQLIFSIQKSQKEYGDLFEQVVVRGQFTNRTDSISPVRIQFHVKYISPKINIKFEGSADQISLIGGNMAVASIKANKIGEYNLDIILGDELKKVEMDIQAKGKLTLSMHTASFYSGQPTRLKLRQRGQKGVANQRCGLLFKPLKTSICYVLGIELIQ